VVGRAAANLATTAASVTHGRVPAGMPEDRRPDCEGLRVSVVVPTLREAENLPHIIPRLPSDIYELIVVDGHSTDDTVAVARSLYPGLRVVYQTRRGKGNALACGIAAARGDIVVTLDADGSNDPEEIPRFVQALEDGADVAKGSRFLESAGSDDITLLRRLGNWVLTRIVNVLFGTRYTDLCYGFNAFRVDLAESLNLDCDGFEVETLFGIRAAKAGLNVVEVPSWERRRIHGTSNLRTFRDGWRVLKTILRERFGRTQAVRTPADDLHRQVAAFRERGSTPTTDSRIESSSQAWAGAPRAAHGIDETT
jgi:glycosyltransferase involved in cell wall biosynthesis